MFPYYCRQPGMCPFFQMGYPFQYPMPYMNYGYLYPPFGEEIEEEEHEHEFEHEHHRDEDDVKEELEENVNEYRMAGPAAPQFIPGQPGVPGFFTNPAEILRYIEFYQPDIIRAMVIQGIPIAEARRLVRRIIAITLRFCRPVRP